MNYRETPCERCGWKFKGFHVCVDLSVPVDPKVQKKHNDSYAHLRTPAWRKHTSTIATERWERYRQDNFERDKRIVEFYAEGMSIRQLALEFKLATQTVRNCILRAQARGEVKMRPPGTNSFWHKGASDVSKV